MNRIKLVMLCVGFFLSFAVAILSVMAAVNHNPHEIYTDNFVALFYIGCAWFGAVFLPFTMAYIVIDIVAMRMGRAK